jgi:hypothetical protein
MKYVVKLTYAFHTGHLRWDVYRAKCPPVVKVDAVRSGQFFIDAFTAREAVGIARDRFLQTKESKKRQYARMRRATRGKNG